MTTNGDSSPKKVPSLEDDFPDLADWGYTVTSDLTPEYNCIAWAAGDDERNWWPTGNPDSWYYWPDGVPEEETVDAFRAAYGTIGYGECDTEDYEDGFEKIAIFADEQGYVKHAARQLSGDAWTSKMGWHVDMTHPLRAVEGRRYGRAVLFMRRPRSDPKMDARADTAAPPPQPVPEPISQESQNDT